jgi:hypothetical protein
VAHRDPEELRLEEDELDRELAEEVHGELGITSDSWAERRRKDREGREYASALDRLSEAEFQEALRKAGGEE